LAKEKPEIMKTYISLYEVVKHIEQQGGSATGTTPMQSSPLVLSVHLQNVRLIAAYYLRSRKNKDEPLIQGALFHSFLHRIHSHFMRSFEVLPATVKRDYFASSSGNLPLHDQQRRLLAMMLAYYNLPHPRLLRCHQRGEPRPSFVQLARQYPHVSPTFLLGVLSL